MSSVQVERRAPVRLVRLDTGRRNALTLDVVEALGEALAPDPDAPAVVLFGKPDGFCVGLDNATLAAGAVERESLLAAMGEVLATALAGPTRIVAACEGHAVAAGAMLLLISDVRFGTPGGYKIGFTEPGLGMPLPELPALLARMRLDRRRFHAAAALGQIFGPEEGADAGFLDAIVAPGDLESRAIGQATKLAALSDAAYQGSLHAAWGDALPRIEELAAAQNRRKAKAIAAAS